MRICKYELEITDCQAINIINAKPTVLSVAEKNGKLVMWIQLEDDPRNYIIDVNIISTDNPFDLDYGKKFVGTVVMSYGIEYHVYVSTIRNIVI